MFAGAEMLGLTGRMPRFRGVNVWLGRVMIC
jgi:hypothetical protein